jgi:hypothetical protein
MTIQNTVSNCCAARIDNGVCSECQEPCAEESEAEEDARQAEKATRQTYEGTRGV